VKALQTNPCLALAASALLQVGTVRADTNATVDAGAMHWSGATPWLDPVPKTIVDLTLDRAIRAAFASAPDVEAAEARMRIARGELGMQRSAYWPYVVFSAGWEQSRAGTEGTGPDNYAASLGANWDIFDGFQREFGVRRARHAHAAATFAADESRRLLQRAVTRVFFWALLAQERMDAAKGDIAFNRMMLDFVAKRYTTGVGSRSDLSNFKIRVAEDVDTYLTQRQQFGFHLAVLGALMAQPLATETHRLRNPYPEPLATMRANLPADIEQALRMRPDAIAYDELAQAAEAGVRVEQGQRLPRVRLSATESVARENSAAFRFSEDNELFIGATLTWDIFKGGRSRHSINIAKAQRDAADAARRQTIREIESEIRQHAQVLAHTRMRVDNGIIAYEAAVNDRDMVTRLYESGLVAITRLNEVQKDVAHSLGRLIMARVLFSQTWEEYRLAIGYVHADARDAASAHQLQGSRYNIDSGATRPIPLHLRPSAAPEQDAE
jgi:outer membrane protein TolC